tara:strand:- start:1161 stop:1586 length:426 start_codon:yes stop_codon:yes gene_type:complete
MKMKIRHTGIVVSDIDKSLYFYNELLGFKIVKDAWETGTFINKIVGLSGVNVRTIKMDAGPSLIELLYFKSHPTGAQLSSLVSLGCTHIALTVDNLDNCFKMLKGENTFFVSEPQTSPDGKAKVAFCKDPDGTFIELVEEL